MNLPTTHAPHRTSAAARSGPPAGHRHFEAGRSALARQHWGLAAQAFSRAARAAPADALYWLNLANAERRARAPVRAEAAARQAMRLAPAEPLARQILGDSLAQQHRYAEAAEVLAELDALGLSDPEAMLSHGTLLLKLQRPREAFEVLMRALASRPAMVAGHAVLGDACRDLGMKREAVECMKTVLALDPDNLEALNHLSFERRHLADWSDFERDTARIAQALATSPPGLARVTAAFGTLSLPLPAALQRVAAEQESAAIAWGAETLPALSAAECEARRQRRVLRLGWVSHDFREHPVSQLLVELLETLDRSRFEITLYSTGPDDGSALRQRVAAAAHRFVDLRGLADGQAAEAIRADGIDLLIDLMGHTRGHRLAVFAARPAPLQLAFLGYPGTTGAGFMDYFIGDAITAPLAHAAQFSEKIAQLPGCFQPNGRWRPQPEDAAEPYRRAQAGLPQDAFVLCAFNHTYKIGPQAFDTWCRVLHRVPRAVLWLKETNGQLHDNLRRAAAERGIAPERIVFAPTLPYAQHFARMALADVFVDTWPYNAHTTAADALWAGLPVLTLPGEGFASRVAASALAAVGLADLAMGSVNDYEAALVTLAQDPLILQGLRQHLVAQRLELPLFDTPTYARGFERLLERAWQRWCSGLRPDHLPAEAAELRA